MQSTKINISTVECATIDSGMTLINSHISKRISLTHCKEIVISEELAKKGIEDYLDTLINNTELTNDAEMVISKCSAKDYIESVNPVFEGLLTRYYTTTLKTNTYTAYATNMNLATFYCLLKDNYFQPYATIGTVSESGKDTENASKQSGSDNQGSSNEEGKQKDSQKESDNSSNKSSDESGKESSNQSESSSKSEMTKKVPIEKSVNADFVAGEYEIDDKNPIQIIGFAAFNQDKLVGEFSGLDSLCFLILNNEFQQSIISIPSPFEDGKYIDVSVSSSKKTKCSVDIDSASPMIHVHAYLCGFGQSINESTSYSNNESINKIKEASEQYIKEHMEDFLYKTSIDYNSDICGFGRFAVKHYLTMEDWENAHWLENYKNCNFDVTVSFTIKAGNVFSET